MRSASRTPDNPSDSLTADDLESAGLSAAQALRLPVQSYTDADGAPHWLRADIEP